MLFCCSIFINFILLLGSSQYMNNIISEPVYSDNNTNTIIFSMNINREIYEETNFGEPPQIAIWLENYKTRKIKTIWVARRAGRRWWKGKIECPTALPLWNSRHKKEKSDYKTRGLIKRLIDAITGATPTGGEFTVTTQVEKNCKYYYFIEVNVSADFNSHFPYRMENGAPDPQVNGQPSILYKGIITSHPGDTSHPKIIGRSEQWAAVDSVISDLTGITTARQLISDIKAVCIQD